MSTMKYLEVTIDLISTFILTPMNILEVSYGGDFACNGSNKLIAFTSIANKYSYHLLCYHPTLRILKRLKSNPLQDGTRLSYKLIPYLLFQEPITCLDFEPEGKLITSIDERGVCLVSGVGSELPNFHIQAKGPNSGTPNHLRACMIYMTEGYFNRCRWNPVIGNSQIATTFGNTELNFINLEAQHFALKANVTLIKDATDRTFDSNFPV